jgi:hypothetical protein
MGAMKMEILRVQRAFAQHTHPLRTTQHIATTLGHENMQNTLAPVGSSQAYDDAS